MTALAHSAQAAACPVRRALTVPKRSQDFFPVTKHNAQSHAFR